ncbi:hypothetical protein PACILC2_52710 [Paenibacillus cisolokensis]|uniref:Uncharacterized protein n=1 Tax=Paenibacillus cisolokensis TaxID=1658519 RepID=A0ABQ4NEP8_9BACL|nr:hypothetical protein PACILC2_52710 [Paenibacillus cisolokensis]
MATTAIWDVTDRLKRVIDYAANPEKLPRIVPSSKACNRCWITRNPATKPKSSCM